MFANTDEREASIVEAFRRNDYPPWEKQSEKAIS